MNDFNKPMSNLNEKYKLLRDKQIIAILDGDTTFGEYKIENITIKISMPYLSGPDLASISTLFGLDVDYWNGKKLSRWQYLDNLIDFCIEKNKCSELLAYLFKKERFSEKLKNCTVQEIDQIYIKIQNTITDKINGFLYFGGNKLKIIGNQFIIKDINSNIKIEVPKIKNIDRDYIISISNRASDDIKNENFDSAITKSRTLVEEVCCYVLEKKSIIPISSGNLNELFKQVKTSYKLHTDHDANKSFNTLISGLNSIITAIAELRNHESDAHGVGNARVEIKDYHARLILNSSTTISDFLISISEQKELCQL